jgi:putative transposase
MRAAGLVGASRRRGGPITTQRDKQARPAPDLVDRDFQAAGPNQLWVADITYVPTAAGFLYLAVVVDVWSRRVVGWAMATHLRAELVLDALNMALGQRRPREVMVWTTAATGIECRRVGRSCDATFREPSRWRLLS